MLSEEITKKDINKNICKAKILKNRAGRTLARLDAMKGDPILKLHHLGAQHTRD